MGCSFLLQWKKTWKQPKCPLIDEWIKKMWYIYTMELYILSHEKGWNNAICSNMTQLEIITLSEVRKKKTNTVWYNLYVESNYGMNEPNYKTETDSQRTDLWLPRGRGQEGKDWQFRISRCKLLYIGWINNRVLQYSTGNYIQYHVINHNGKEYV